MRNLYSECLKTENIIKAITEINSKLGSRTPGPDGITFKSRIPLDKIISEVKLRLRRYKRVNSKNIEIPKGNGEMRKLTIINLFDRYAQQAIFRVISPFVESKMSRHSYGFRKGVSAKIPVSSIANIIMKSKESYTVEIDFTKCFDNIPLDRALDKLRELGVKDSRLIKTIKHLMFISREYSGVGLGQKTILGPLLANCYLDILDRFMEREFDLDVSSQYMTLKRANYLRNKNTWIKWLESKNRKISCRYFRYADDTIILTTVKEEQEEIYRRLIEFIETEMEVEVNLAKSRKRRDKTDFLGFHIIKSASVWIMIKNEKKIRTEIKRIKLENYNGVKKFKRYLIGILNYFDMANNLRDILRYIDNYLYHQSRRYGYIQLEYGGINRIFRSRTSNSVIDIWKMRTDSKTSLKLYIQGKSWIKEREALVDFENNDSEWYIYKWLLFTIQKGRDKITKEPLKAKDCVIHHIIPRSKNGSHNLENLILLSKETHEALHYGVNLPKEFEKYRKHLS